MGIAPPSRRAAAHLDLLVGGPTGGDGPVAAHHDALRGGGLLNPPNTPNAAASRHATHQHAVRVGTCGRHSPLLVLQLLRVPQAKDALAVRHGCPPGRPRCPLCGRRGHDRVRSAVAVALHGGASLACSLLGPAHKPRWPGDVLQQSALDGRRDAPVVRAPDVPQLDCAVVAAADDATVGAEVAGGVDGLCVARERQDLCARLCVRRAWGDGHARRGSGSPAPPLTDVPEDELLVDAARQELSAVGAKVHCRHLGAVAAAGAVALRGRLLAPQEVSADLVPLPQAQRRVSAAARKVLPIRAAEKQEATGL